MYYRETHKPGDFWQSGGTGDWQTYKGGVFLMLNIAYTYIILGSKASRELPTWAVVSSGIAETTLLQ